MITGVHTILFSSDADATRAFLADVLELDSVDAGDGWSIFRLPPAELAAHPADEPGGQELYLMCDDIERTLAELDARGAKRAAPVSDEGWGLLSAIEVPGGGRLGIYEPRHPTAIEPQ